MGRTSSYMVLNEAALSLYQIMQAFWIRNSCSNGVFSFGFDDGKDTLLKLHSSVQLFHYIVYGENIHRL